MSLRFIPPASHPTQTQTTSHSAPSAPGVHDTLRAGLTSQIASSTATISAHPLEARLKNWHATQEAHKMEALRRVYGIAEPVRRGMELSIVRGGEFWVAPELRVGEGGSSVHEDILRGRDGICGWEDVFKGDEMLDLPNFHAEMERRLKMDW